MLSLCRCDALSVAQLVVMLAQRRTARPIAEHARSPSNRPSWIVQQPLEGGAAIGTRWAPIVAHSSGRCLVAIWRCSSRHTMTAASSLRSSARVTALIPMRMHDGSSVAADDALVLAAESSCLRRRGRRYGEQHRSSSENRHSRSSCEIGGHCSVYGESSRRLRVGFLAFLLLPPPPFWIGVTGLDLLGVVALDDAILREEMISIKVLMR